ncbi:carbohydrate porin [Massilia sp. BJB1822]|uniref:carbohydrate porin n=1 Tax=Massilia sp. BJB1822 TaxID=2744470 RepID=UPI001594AFE1|nr:carbohydrate porin [Massilia sp. BJB1822]NVD97013.1 carbohydrate porin [Massilia sp. BJB1822]
MCRTFPLSAPKALALGAALLCAAAGAQAAPSQAELIKLLEKLNQRVERLEQRNTELERELRAAHAPQSQAAANVEERVQVLEKQQESLARSLETDAISEKEPELTMRLKAIESQAQGMLAAARKVDALDGISAGLCLTTVVQKNAKAGSQLNYRGDGYISLPLEAIGDIKHKVFAQFRLGQGAGLNEHLSTYSAPNATAFRLASLPNDDSAAMLAQAWYQADIPLPFGGFAPRSKERLEVNFGKMDPFVFFDQNGAAGDETRQFMNAAFVHNPLLDAGHDIGVDGNGFAPGMRLSYYNVQDKQQPWRLSLGVFGAGKRGANYEHSLVQPMVMVQAETEQRFFGGLAGNYRVYAWRNPQAAHYDESITEQEVHTGWGVSADQRVGDGVTLFGRYGHQVKGNVRFDRALTLGAEFNGSYWDRGADSLGLAFGLLKNSRSFNAAGSGEQVAELYYRYRINKQLELSPNIQYIGHPGGDRGADAMKILGVRAQLTY